MKPRDPFSLCNRQTSQKVLKIKLLSSDSLQSPAPTPRPTRNSKRTQTNKQVTKPR